MNNIYKTLKHLLLLLIAGFFAVKCFRLITRPNTELDMMAMQLTPIRNSLKGRAHIGFYTNDTTATNSMQLYFYSQFIVHPAIIKRPDIQHPNYNLSDTVLVIVNTAKPYKEITGYKTLVRSAGGGFICLLLKKDDHVACAEPAQFPVTLR